MHIRWRSHNGSEYWELVFEEGGYLYEHCFNTHEVMYVRLYEVTNESRIDRYIVPARCCLPRLEWQYFAPLLQPSFLLAPKI